MMYISDAVELLLGSEDRQDVVEILGITSANLSQWRNENNTHTPRFETCVKIYGNYDLVVYPYAEEALKKEWEKLQ